MSQTKQPIKNLTTEERIRLEKRLLQRRQVRATGTKPGIPARSSGASCAPSFAQQRLWFLAQLEPGSAAYNISRADRLTGVLDTTVLEKSLNAIIARHEVLRTTLARIDNQPMQVIASEMLLPLPVVDLTGFDKEQREREVHRLVTEASARPFDLEQAPLLRVKLLRLEPEVYVLVLTIHHIVSDGWSMGVMMRELSALYGAFITGQSSPLEALPIQYADFSVWQREWLQGEELARQLGYWKEQLNGLLPLTLPTDRPRPAEQSYRGANYQFEFPDNLTEGLRSLARHQGATLYMTLLAAFQVLLSRYSGQGDIAVGSPIAGRNRAEIEGLIGFFVNTLVLRADLSGNPTFLELLGRVRETCLGAYAHQDLPFEKLVEELAPVRDRSYNPLWQVFFALQNVPRGGLVLPDVKIERVEVDNETAKVDLALALIEKEGRLGGVATYNTDLFDAETIAHMMGHYLILLESIVTDPHQRVGVLPLLTEAERHQLLVEWNDTAADHPEEHCIHQLFEVQAKRTPEAAAVEYGQERLSYAQLNHRANRLAEYLRARGVGPEVIVGVCMDRSADMLVSLLAILKAGGAYLPLDPAYPQERVSFMLEDSGARIVLTQSHLLADLPGDSGKYFPVDVEWPAIEAISDGSEGRVCPENLAYIIYTSGSTGKPKGVMIEHGAATNFLYSMAVEPGIGPGDIVAAVTTICFDISVLELFLPLTCGACVQIVPREVAVDGKRLAQELVSHKSTMMQATPSTWQMLIQTGWHGGEGFRALCGGEPMSVELAAALLDRSAEVWNLYGPTEATVWVACHRVDRTESIVPIGRPIANTRIYVLDQHMQPVPTGVPGDLYVGGAQLARGYQNQPELTAAVFVDDPFGSDANARLYRTGDLARVRADGCVECLGRTDYQVKIRGHRIELGEIELVLGEHPAVYHCVVSAREFEGGGRRLIAYFVPHTGFRPTAAELREFVKASLPEYMVPAAYISLDALPMTANGKIDRKALPEPVDIMEERCDQSRPPRDPVELAITKCWSEVLKVPTVRLEDNFFDLGGHSLLALNLADVLEQALGISVPVTELFAHPTPASLAEFVNRGGRALPETGLVPIHATGECVPMYCVFGDVAFLTRHLGSDQPLYWFYSRHRTSREKLPPGSSMEKIASYLLDQLRQSRPDGPYVLAGFCVGAAIAYEMAQQLRNAGEDVPLLVLFDPFPTGTAFLRLRVRRELRRLKEVGNVTDQVNYVFSRGNQIVRRWLGMPVRTAPLPAPVLESTETKLPAGSYSYVHPVAESAHKRYQYRPYAGNTIVFLREAVRIPLAGSDPEAVWKQLIRGQYQCFEMTGAAHTEFFHEPHAEFIADKIKAMLAGVN